MKFSDDQSARLDAIVARSDAFEESKHPRASDGKFGSGGGGGGRAKEKTPLMTKNPHTGAMEEVPKRAGVWLPSGPSKNGSRPVK